MRHFLSQRPFVGTLEQKSEKLKKTRMSQENQDIGNPYTNHTIYNKLHTNVVTKNGVIVTHKVKAYLI